MRRALLLSLALALPLEAQRTAPVGISRSMQPTDSLPAQSQPVARPSNRAVWLESLAGVGGAMFGVIYMGAAFLGCDDFMTVSNFDSGSGPDCFDQQLIGIAVVGPIGATFATSMARAVTGTRGSALASWGGALLGTVIGAGGSVLLTRALPGADPAVAAFSMMVLGQGTFAALAGRKPEWEK